MGEQEKMVRCLDCYNLVEAFLPATVQGALFDEKWRCKAKGRVFEEYYLVEIERECLHKKHKCALKKYKASAR